MALGNLILTALVAAVLPLKPPLSAEARRHPGPTVIRAGELGKRRLEVEGWRLKGEVERQRMRREVEALKKSARDLADRMEKMTVDDLLKRGGENWLCNGQSVEQSTNRKIEKFSDLERAMKRAGKPQAEIDRLRNQLEQTVENIRAEGRELKRKYDKQR